MKVVKFFIWVGFTALLAVSLPKIAWVLRSYEDVSPVTITLAGLTLDARWIVPLAVAVCIDALMLSLTYAMSVDKAKASQVGMWTFVAFLCGVSYFCNLLYNYAHAPVGSVWSDAFVSTVTPLIISGVPLFALCYTLILSRIEGKGETLAERATRLEDARAAKKRIVAAQEGRFTGGIKSLITGAGDIAKHTGKTLETTRKTPAKEGQNQRIPGTLLTVKPAHEETQNQSIDARIAASKTEESGEQTDQYLALSPDVFALTTAFPNLTALLSTGHKTATYNEVEKAMGQSHKMVLNRVKDGTLRTAPRNDKLVVIASVIEWAKTLLTGMQTPEKEQVIPVAKAPIALPQKEQQSTGKTLGMIEQRMYDTLSKDAARFAELLRLSDTMTVPQMTAFLKKEYRDYAVYITEERVGTVLTYARRKHPELHNGHHAHEMPGQLVEIT